MCRSSWSVAQTCESASKRAPSQTSSMRLIFNRNQCNLATSFRADLNAAKSVISVLFHMDVTISVRVPLQRLSTILRVRKQIEVPTKAILPRSRCLAGDRQPAGLRERGRLEPETETAKVFRPPRIERITVPQPHGGIEFDRCHAAAIIQDSYPALFASPFKMQIHFGRAGSDAIVDDVRQRRARRIAESSEGFDKCRRPWGCEPTASPHQFRHERSFLEIAGCASRRRLLASIWRIRSRVTPYCSPTSSSV
jgi:hypothetical protein